MRKLLLLVLFAGYAATVMAQADNAAVLQALQQLQQTYSKPGYLSFDVQYKYAPEATPGSYQDSLRGQVKIHGKQHWAQLDNTEMINLQDYMIAVFREDKLMYLSKPLSTSTGYSPATGAMDGRWVQLLDSLLMRKDQLQAHVEETKERRTIVLDYLQPKELKKIAYLIDKRTGYLVGITSTIRADQLYDPSIREKVTGDAYAIMETWFTNYSTTAFDTGLFSTARYFTKQNGNYTCASAYKDYTVYLASAGL